MNLNNNYFKLLDNDISSKDESDIEVKVKVEVKVDDNKVNSEFLNSKSTSNKKSHLKKRTRKQKNSQKNSINKFPKVQVYDEIGNLPSSMEDAIKLKQNLTLKQILVLMNLHAIPEIVVNQIHDKIQHQVHKMSIKIAHNGRIFYVSLYYWYDLKKIETLINNMFDIY